MSSDLAGSVLALIEKRVAGEPGCVLHGVAQFLPADEACAPFFFRFGGASGSGGRGHHSSPDLTLRVTREFLETVLRGETWEPWTVTLETQPPRGVASPLRYYLGHLLNQPSAASRVLVRTHGTAGPPAPEVIEIAPWDESRTRVAAIAPLLFTGALRGRAGTWTASSLATEHAATDFGGVPGVRLFGEPTAAAPYADGVPWPAALDGCLDLDFIGARARDKLLFGGQATPGRALRSEPLDTYLLHVFGKLEVTLFAPGSAATLYPLQSYGGHRPSWVDWRSPNLARHPLFADARGLSIVLRPGELLVVPRGWFHASWAAERSLSLAVLVS
jgi:hypothetical protein